MPSFEDNMSRAVSQGPVGIMLLVAQLKKQNRWDEDMAEMLWMYAVDRGVDSEEVIKAFGDAGG